MFSPYFLEFTLVFLHIFLVFSNFEFKNHRFLISDQTDPDEFQKMQSNFLTLIMGRYLNIFARKSASKQLSHLHYENLYILGIVAPQFPLCFRFQLSCNESA
jgi:hypothetical protein